MSFGFKYGIPVDADLVVDLRFLPNPYWVPELRPHTGLDAAVADYVLRPARAPSEFLDGSSALLEPMVAGYLREGKRYVTVAVGCTGGKHRRVAMAEALAAAARRRRRRHHPRAPGPGAGVSDRPGGRRARRRARAGGLAGRAAARHRPD